MSQHRDLMLHLNEYPITQLIAANKYSILRLSERIRELEWRGFIIDRRTAHGTNRHGNAMRYTVYSLSKCVSNRKLFKSLYGTKKACK